MLEFVTQGFNGYSTKWSPFIDSRLAVAASANFGLVGNGRLYILNITPTGVVAEHWFATQDSLFDLSWSETHENHVLVASGDGSIKLFDITLEEFPIRSWQEHKREVFSVHWNLVAKDTFCSSSWDGTVKIWSPDRSGASLLTLPTHSCTYSTLWSPHSPSILSAVTSDSHLRLFDLRTPTSAANHLTLSLPIHAPAYAPSEVLTHDWNKYREHHIATAGVDKLIRVFDLRAPSKGPYAILPGHEYAVRKIAWSPHASDLLLSGSYDMSCRIWSLGPDVDGQPMVPGPNQTGGELGCMMEHTEFVTGLDWCLFGVEGWCATCAWDERVLVWDARSIMSSPPPPIP